MAQQNLAFITGQTGGGEPLDASLRLQVERFVAVGRNHIVVVMDTLPNLEEGTIAALQVLLHRATELHARVTCVALEDRVAAALRAAPLSQPLNIIRRVDEIPAA